VPYEGQRVIPLPLFLFVKAGAKPASAALASDVCFFAYPFEIKAY
jgi:hypothetical protein